MDSGRRQTKGPLSPRERDGERGVNKLLQRAKAMRTHATDAERILWRHLRGGRLNGYKFRRQVVIEPYIVDFVCLGAKLIIEADGGQHGEQEVYDRHRTQKLESMGYTVMRFWNHDILKQTDSVMEMILTRLMKSSPHPDPLPGGEGEGRRGG